MSILLLQVLIWAHVLWVLYYGGINIAGYCVSNTFSDAQVAKSVRQDLFGLGTHVVVFVALLQVYFDSKHQWQPWVLFIMVFECIRDTLNAVEITWYSLVSQNGGMLVAAAVLVWYQFALSVLAAAAWLVSNEKQERRSSSSKRVFP